MQVAKQPEGRGRPRSCSTSRLPSRMRRACGCDRVHARSTSRSAIFTAPRVQAGVVRGGRQRTPTTRRKRKSAGRRVRAADACATRGACGRTLARVPVRLRNKVRAPRTTRAAASAVAEGGTARRHKQDACSAINKPNRVIVFIMRMDPHETQCLSCACLSFLDHPPAKFGV